MKPLALHICGTGSGVGKSVIVSALCRIFLQDGYKVCPFKAQNMALNSFVTKEGGEIGRAQAIQALACGLEPEVDMNPVLIKPTADTSAQIIIRGKPIGSMRVRQYINQKKKLIKIVRESFRRLSKRFEIVVLEGAGSPAEINLKSHDIVNLKMARYADAPVILTGDIDKGGVFAWIVGTLDLLTKAEKRMIKGIIINKFRGDRRLLKGAIDFLEKRTGIKVLGVLPYFKDIKIPEEDSLPVEKRGTDNGEWITDSKKINIAVIKLPHISNFTDFDALENEPDVNLYYARNKEELKSPDIIILPGSKNTIEDLGWLKKTSIADKILTTYNLRHTTTLIGICGGYQMLGKNIRDRKKLESAQKEIDGLGILPIVTNLEKEKVLSQVRAKEIISGLEVSGYQIHHGITRGLKKQQPIFKITGDNKQTIDSFDGIAVENGRAWGTYIHGIFDADIFRRDFLNRIRLKKNWPPIPLVTNFNPDNELNKLAELVRKNIDMEYLYKILRKV